MWGAAHNAVARAREGRGPTLLEARTFRFRGHLLGDNGHYIPKDEMSAATAADPMPRFRLWLQRQGHADEATLAQIESANQQQIEAAVEFAAASPYPGLEELDRDVYAEVIP
jgi:pyruvate dehydrogenase E1 component alpha subunit